MTKIEFAWNVHAAGYEVAEISLDLMPASATPFDDRRIVRPRQGPKPLTKPTAPLTDTPDLFVRFLALAPDDAALTTFANTHGLLGLDPVDGGELRTEWIEQIRLVGQVYHRWEIHEGRMAWDTARAFVDPVFQTRQADPREQPKTTNVAAFKRWQEDVGKLKASLREQINATINANMRRYCTYGSALNEKGGSLTWDHSPNSLLGVIWLQVLWHVSGKVRWHVCPRPGCGTWISNDDRKAGREKVYCHGRCRVAVAKAKRRERDRAARLRPRTRRG